MADTTLAPTADAPVKKQTLLEHVQELVLANPEMQAKEIHSRARTKFPDAAMNTVLSYVSQVRRELKPATPPPQPTLGEIRVVMAFVKEHPDLPELLEKLAPVLAVGPVEKILEIYQFIKELTA